MHIRTCVMDFLVQPTEKKLRFLCAKSLSTNSLTHIDRGTSLPQVLYLHWKHNQIY